MTKDEAMTTEEALAWVDNTGGVRERWPDLEDNAVDALAAEVRAQQGRVCDECAYQKGVVPMCNLLTTLSRGKYPIYCKDVGNTCGSWKEKAHDDKG